MKKFFSTLVFCLLLMVTSFAFVGCDDDKLFEIEVDQCQNGIITVNKSQAKEGEEIIVSAYPEEGYELALITCNGVSVENMRFKMPRRDVELQALFRATTEENVYQLHLGTYTCEGYWGEDGLYPINGDARRYCFAVFKENNKMDAFYNGILMSDISYSRLGNDFSINLEQLQLTLDVKILSDNLIFFKAGQSYVVMQYQPDVVMPIGTFQSTLQDDTQEGQNISITFKEGNKLDLVVGDYINQENIDYIIFGNRLVINYTAENVNGVYVEIGLSNGQEINGFDAYNVCIMRAADENLWLEQQVNYLYFYR